MLALRLTLFLGFMLTLLVTFVTAGGGRKVNCDPCIKEFDKCIGTCLLDSDVSGDWAEFFCKGSCCDKMNNKFCGERCKFNERCAGSHVAPPPRIPAIPLLPTSKVPGIPRSSPSIPGMPHLPPSEA